MFGTRPRRDNSSVPIEMKELGVVRIATPCRAKWEAMTGTARVRFCGACHKNVYNLSDLTADEARLLFTRSEGRLCVRFWARKDGTVITRDCPIGVRWRRYKWIAAALVFLQALAAAVWGLSDNRPGEGPLPYPVSENNYRMGKTMKNFGQNNAY